MTTLFYAPPERFRGGYVTLPEDEARHAVKVLRHEAGDEVTVVDGAGGWFRVRLDHAGTREASGVVVEERRAVGEPGYDLTVGLALVKSRNRYETFLEKAVELGVRRIVPLLTDRTEKTGIKRGRAERILKAGMKQTGRSRLVGLDAPTTLDAFLDEVEGPVFMCHEATDEERRFMDAVRSVDDDRPVTVLVGPEGGFTDDEVAAARAAGCRLVSLGPRRLRAETAAIAAATAVMLAHA